VEIDTIKKSQVTHFVTFRCTLTPAIKMNYKKVITHQHIA